MGSLAFPGPDKQRIHSKQVQKQCEILGVCADIKAVSELQLKIHRCIIGHAGTHTPVQTRR